jgi:hypothetical protein
MSLAQNIKNENLKIELADRYEIAYEQAKKSLLKSTTNPNP